MKRKLLPPETCVAGIDMSLNHPAIVILKDKQIRCYWLKNHTHETDFSCVISSGPLQGYTLSGVCVERRTDEELQHFGKVEFFNRCQEAISLIEGAISDVAPILPHIAIEGFAEGYGIHLRKVQNVLKTVGGCLRMRLSQLGCEECKEIAPTSIKKFWTGRGSATKEQMYDAWITKWNMPDLFAPMHLKRKVHSRTGELTKIPHPVHDIVDAFATLVCAQKNPHTKKKKPKHGFL